MSVNITIPRSTAAETLAWGQTFVAGIEASPGTYQVDTPTVVQLRTLIDDYQAAYDEAGVLQRVAVQPETYTKGRRAAMYTARSNFLGLASQLAVQIQVNSAISDQDKVAIGVQPRNSMRTPIPPPSTAPLIDIIAMTSGLHQLEYADTTTPSSRAKPFGVAGLQLFVAITEAEVTPTFPDADFYGLFTKSPVQVAFDPTDATKKATYWARWMNRKGQEGPISGAVSGIIAFVV
jgi:hypothetical protein